MDALVSGEPRHTSQPSLSSGCTCLKQMPKLFLSSFLIHVKRQPVYREKSFAARCCSEACVELAASADRVVVAVNLAK